MSISAGHAGGKPATDGQTLLLSALIQAPAGKITPLSEQLGEQDFTPSGWIVFSEVLRHAQDAAQQDRNTVLNFPVIHASLNAQGALQDQDNGVRALLTAVATTPADPAFIPQLVAGLLQQAYRRALTVYQDWGYPRVVDT